MMGPIPIIIGLKDHTIIQFHTLETDFLNTPFR
jgi:uncharacterized membrane protein